LSKNVVFSVKKGQNKISPLLALALEKYFCLPLEKSILGLRWKKILPTPMGDGTGELSAGKMF